MSAATTGHAQQPTHSPAPKILVVEVPNLTFYRRARFGELKT
jgi:hypothetical protein